MLTRRAKSEMTLAIVGAIVLGLTLGGCDGPRRIPRIEPNLQNWQQPYVGVPGLRVHIFNTGGLTVPSALVYSGGSWFAPRELEIIACVIEHPSAGLIVFDTGFSPRIATEPNAYLGWLSIGVGVFSMAEGQDLPTQMRAAGLAPAAVSYVVLSDLHFDHTGSVEAFANATVVVARNERPGRSGGEWYEAALVSGDDYDGVSDWFEIDFNAKEPYATFFAHHDLIGDGSLQLVDLSGHSSGSQGMIVRTTDGPILLTGDAVWVEENWRYGTLPLVAYDLDLLWEQLWRIKKFAQMVPSLTIVPGHDTRGLVRAEVESLEVHSFDVR